jgi:RHS repeat-associated protein
MEKAQAKYIHSYDYYPFGMMMQERSFTCSTNENKFSFNGKEMDNETYQGSIAFEARIYDSRLGRFFSTDPRELEYTWQSTYVYFKNCPTSIIDLLGEGGSNPGKIVLKGEGATQFLERNGASSKTKDGWLPLLNELRKANPTAFDENYDDNWSNEDKWNYWNNQKLHEGQELNLPRTMDLKTYAASPMPAMPTQFDLDLMLTKSRINPSPPEQKKEDGSSGWTVMTPEVSANVQFGVGASGRYISGDFATINLIGIENNNFYVAGVNQSNNSSQREIAKGYSFTTPFIGIEKKVVKEGSYNNEENKSETKSASFLSIYHVSNTYYPQEKMKVRVHKLGTSVSFGLIMMPQGGFFIPIKSDTVYGSF